MTDQGSELVARILDYIGSSALKEISWISGVKDELHRIGKTLAAIQAVIFDVQEQQSTSHSVRNWLQNLKSVAYDIEDVLDLISTQDLELKVNGRSLFRKISRLFTNYDVARELKVIQHRLDEIEYNRRSFNVEERHKTPLLVGNAVQRETYSYGRESDVIGREEDKGRIIDLLISSSYHEHECLSVVPIVGIGGMGKTTLARMVYNDPAVVKMFDLRLWVHVSNKFVLRKLISDILQTTTSPSFSDLNMETLQNMLRARLKGQTYIIILDDVWIRDPKQWVEIKELLAIGSPRSRVIVTTRDERVASITGTMETYRLKGLSNDDCWSIFAKYAFSKCEYKEFQFLVEIGKSIVRKCKGVPLAAKTLGSVLYGERDVCIWEKIEESELWEIEQGPDDILPALQLSYDQTPYHLRSCFAVCAYKKSYPLFVNHLINTWMALGLLQSSRDGEEAAEILGYRYSNELLSRSFFQFPGFVVTKDVVTNYWEVFNEWSPWHNLGHIFKNDFIENADLNFEEFFLLDDRVVVVEMHGLLHDLATYVSEKDTSIVSSNSKSVSPDVKHILWDHEDLSKKDFPLQVLNASKARIFSFVHPMGLVSKSFLKGLLSSLKCLRILNLHHSKFEELPDSVGDLKHLRYLNLSFNSKLLRLPQTTSKLVNLQSLDVFRCMELQSIPKDIHKLIRLRYICLASKITCLLDNGIYKLSCLENLRLWCCRHLRSISERIGQLHSLRSLTIVKCPEIASLPNDMKCLTNLVELRIFDCRSLDLKGWEGLCGMRSLKYLDFRELPKLLNFPEWLDSTCSGSLQYLRIDRCYNLRTMSVRLQHCTSLLRLNLIICPTLTSLPRDMHATTSLQVLNIVGCPTISHRCKKDIGDDWNLISHIPEIHIDNEVIQKKVPN